MPWRHQRIDKRLIFGADLHLQRADVSVPLRLGTWPDNRRTDRRVVQYPGNRKLDNPYATPLGVLLDLLGDAQRLHTPFGFQDAFVLARRAAAGFGGNVRGVFTTKHATGQCGL